MEKLKSAIPNNIKQMIGESTSDDLPHTCSSLLDFLHHFQPFHHMVKDLADAETGLCGKNKDEALRWKKKGNQCFVSEDYANALDCYTQALRVAPIDADDMDKNLVATLYMNRASVFHKMNLLTECLRDCDRALQLSPSYAKAWYRRGRVNISLGNYKDAINDLDVSKIVESSLAGKRQIESELKSLLDQYSSMASPSVQHTGTKLNVLDEPNQISLQCVNTPDKARGMNSISNIPPASFVHSEEPYAMIILKSCRETHCHYCLNELPVDKVPCPSCSIPLYCSQNCQLQAGDKISQNYPKDHGIHKSLSANLLKYVAEITLAADSETGIEQIPEHKHECHGVHWSAVMPSEIVLAGRVFIKSIMQRRGSSETASLRENLDLSHHYSQMSPESKLELHIYSTVLLHCLQCSSVPEIQINGSSVAQIVILVSQIRVNSMTIVRIKSIDVHDVVDQYGKSSSGALTSNVEQVRVGQAIYKTGSLFNHSCQPNIHAYFISRTLVLRTTEFVAAGCPLELSYGPQIGQWDCKDRIKFLEDEYFFRCQCRGCSEVNMSDLFLNAFHCNKPNCSGIILDTGVLDSEKHKIKQFLSLTSTSSLENQLQVENSNNDHIKELNVFLHSNSLNYLKPGYCLKCGSYRDLELSCTEVDKAWNSIRRLEEAIVSEEVSSSILSNASRSLVLLKSILHAYNRRIAEVEDKLAQAFCLVGELQLARDHCKASIEILEKLYHPNHIVIGHELVKLSSIQLSLDDSAALDNINRLSNIFSCYYGSHVHTIFPLLQFLQIESRKFVL